MRVHLALYDPSTPSPDGSFWSWHERSIPNRTRERLYFEIAINARPQDANSLRGSDLWGGAAVVDQEWACVYRFANGGRDTRGRPGRFVLIAAFHSILDLPHADLLAVITSDLVQTVMAQAVRTCPVPQPASLVVDIATRRAFANTEMVARILQHGPQTLTGPGAAMDALNVFSGLPLPHRGQCIFRVVGGQGEATIQLGGPDRTTPLPKKNLRDPEAQRVGVPGRVLSPPDPKRSEGGAVTAPGRPHIPHKWRWFVSGLALGFIAGGSVIAVVYWILCSGPATQTRPLVHVPPVPSSSPGKDSAVVPTTSRVPNHPVQPADREP